MFRAVFHTARLLRSHQSAIFKRARSRTTFEICELFVEYPLLLRKEYRLLVLAIRILKLKRLSESFYHRPCIVNKRCQWHCRFYQWVPHFLSTDSTSSRRPREDWFCGVDMWYIWFDTVVYFLHDACRVWLLGVNGKNRCEYLGKSATIPQNIYSWVQLNGPRAGCCSGGRSRDGNFITLSL